MAKGKAAALAFPALVFGSAALAFGPLFVRMADVSPIASAFWRLGLALPFMLAAFAWRPQGRPATGRHWRLLALAGLFFAADLAVWHGGIVRTTMANATLFGNVSSFFLAGYAFLVLRTPLSGRFGLALLLAVAGIALLLGRSFELSPRHFVGDLMCIAAAMLYTGYLVLIDRVRASVAPVPALAIATLAGAAALLPVALAFGQPVLPSDWAPLVLLALGSQVVGQGLIVFAMGHLRPEVSGLGLLSQPVAAAAIGWLALGERLAPLDLVGAGLVLFSLVLARWPGRRAGRVERQQLG